MNGLLNRLQAVDFEPREMKPRLNGRLVRVVGLTLEAVGLKAALGDLCEIETEDGVVDAEVVGFSGNIIYLMPTGEMGGIVPGARVRPKTALSTFPYGDHLLGRVVDGMGNPIDGLGPLKVTADTHYKSKRINPMARRPIREHLDVGVRAINSLLTIGQGQRMGLFAGSGVGKSVLLGMMTRGTTADVVVVGLIGERGREVREFIDDILGPEGRARSVVVAAPADSSPLMRLKGCETTLQIAEYFRDEGRNVLLLVDSLTRYAMAQREIALSVGEPPATRGYPPSVFAKLPALVERAGNGGEHQGSITAIFTVLVEGDDLQDPIADAARAILDGHIVLSRELADSGHFPAIDVEKSISRVMPAIVTEEHMVMARTIRQCLSQYSQNRELISIGAYHQGTDARIDQAIMIKPHIDTFLQQGMKEVIPYAASLDELRRLSMILIDDAKQRLNALQAQAGAQGQKPLPNRPQSQPVARMNFKKKA